MKFTFKQDQASGRAGRRGDVDPRQAARLPGHQFWRQAVVRCRRLVAAATRTRRCDISPIAFKDGKRIAEAIPMTRLEDLPPNTEAGHVAGAVCARFASR